MKSQLELYRNQNLISKVYIIILLFNPVIFRLYMYLTGFIRSSSSSRFTLMSVVFYCLFLVGAYSLNNNHRVYSSFFILSSISNLLHSIQVNITALSYSSGHTSNTFNWAGLAGLLPYYIYLLLINGIGMYLLIRMLLLRRSSANITSE